MAGVSLSAGVAVVARVAVGRRRVRAGAGGVVDAGPRHVALVLRGTGHANAVVDAGADPGGADIVHGVRVAVVAPRAVGLVGEGAGAVAVARARFVALVGGGAGVRRIRAATLPLIVVDDGPRAAIDGAGIVVVAEEGIGAIGLAGARDIPLPQMSRHRVLVHHDGPVPVRLVGQAVTERDLIAPCAARAAAEHGYERQSDHDAYPPPPPRHV